MREALRKIWCVIAILAVIAAGLTLGFAAYSVWNAIIAITKSALRIA